MATSAPVSEQSGRRDVALVCSGISGNSIEQRFGLDMSPNCSPFRGPRAGFLPLSPPARPAEGYAWMRVLILCLPILMMVGWIASLAAGDGYVDALGNPVGGDFPMFYIAGQMAWQGEWSQLYDEPLQQARLIKLLPSLPADTYLPYRYPPLVAILAAPLAALPYRAALIVFAGASLAVWLVSIRRLTRLLVPQLDATTATAILAVAVAPVMLQSLIDGQASTWWFAIATACWWCLARGRQVEAGSWLALAACKPNVMLLLGVVLLVRYPRMLFGAVVVGSLMSALTWLVAGTDCLAAYAELGRELALAPWRVETPYWKVQSLLSWTELAVGPALARRTNLGVGLVSAVLIALWWRSQPSRPATDAQALCAALLVNALCNPYTPVYDLTLLGLGAIVCVAALANGAWPGTSSVWLQRRDVIASLSLLLAGPIVSQAIAKTFRSDLQAMPLCMLAVTAYWLVAARRRRSPLPAPPAVEPSSANMGQA